MHRRGRLTRLTPTHPRTLASLHLPSTCLPGSLQAREPDHCAGLQKKVPANSAQVHGCPYAHYGRSELLTMLEMELGVGDATMRETIADTAERDGAGAACRAEWAARMRAHARGARLGGGGNAATLVGTTPLAYFRASQ